MDYGTIKLQNLIVKWTTFSYQRFIKVHHIWNVLKIYGNPWFQWFQENHILRVKEQNFRLKLIHKLKIKDRSKKKFSPFLTLLEVIRLEFHVDFSDTTSNTSLNVCKWRIFILSPVYYLSKQAAYFEKHVCYWDIIT